MTALAAVIAVGLLLVGVVWWTSRPRILRERTRKTVVVTLKSGVTFSGVLWQTDSEAFVLRNAEALAVGERRETAPVDGELVLLRADIDYTQLT